MSRDAAVKAGAELRLARNLRKAGRAEAALEIYGDLARVTGASLSVCPPNWWRAAPAVPCSRN